MCKYIISYNQLYEQNDQCVLTESIKFAGHLLHIVFNEQRMNGRHEAGGVTYAADFEGIFVNANS